MSTESPYHLVHLLRFKQISLNSDFRHVFFHMYIAPGQGQTTVCGQNSDVNRKALSLCPFVASFKMISSKSDFIHIFNDFIHVYSPGARADKPFGTNFCPFVASFKKISLRPDFIHIFACFYTCIYSPGAGADSPLWSEFLF